MSIPDLLREKSRNMQRWLLSEGCELETQFEDASNIQLLLMAQQVHALRSAIDARDFDGLCVDKDMPVELLNVIAFVVKRTELHDKFWRYLTLFSDAVKEDG